MIISYEQLRIHQLAMQLVDVRVCICDEGHRCVGVSFARRAQTACGRRLKNQTAVLTKAIRSLRCPSRILLSGTPIVRRRPSVRRR